MTSVGGGGDPLALDPLSMMNSSPIMHDDDDDDPLSANTPSDPLSLATSSNYSNSKIETLSQNMENVRQTAKDLLADQLPSTANWHIKKQQMIRDYAVSEAQQITVSSSNIEGFSGSGGMYETL